MDGGNNALCFKQLALRLPEGSGRSTSPPVNGFLCLSYRI